MKIISFNINGLNAFNNKGNIEKLLEDTNADIYCFQETKISKAKENLMKSIYENKLSSYTSYNCICKFKNGYAGVSTLVNNRLLNRITNVSCPNILENDETFEKYGEGRIVTIEFDTFMLVNAYVINSGNKELARIKFDKSIKSYISTLEKPCIFAGDMNVCSSELDYWGNYSRAKNLCPGLFEFEINGFNDLIQECHLVDSYRFKNGNKKQYSWFSPFGSKTSVSSYDLKMGWRIDYILVSDSIKDKIYDAKIYEGWNKKDHSPIEMEIDI